MGVEAYGLVGFFSMLQILFNMLDIGLTPTMSRETARYRGGASDAINYRIFTNSIEILFIVIAIVGFIIIYCLAGVIANKWLKVTQLPIEVVQNSIRLMAFIIAVRWSSGLRRAIISGSELFVWLSTFNSSIVTLRFIGVLPVLYFFSSSPITFFIYQLLVALLEFCGLYIKTKSILPVIPQNLKLKLFSWKQIKPYIGFSTTIAFTSSVWVLLTQTDKLVLSKVLTLSEYGYFTLAVLVAGGITIISGPISSAIMPRMVKLEAEHKHEELILLYRRSTQFVALITGSVAVTLAFCAEPLLWAWTGDKLLANKAAPITVLYAIGNGILAVSAFPYYLQYAKGDLQLHLFGNIIFMVLLIPSIIWAASKYGGIGAAMVWFIMNLVLFLAWLPLIHHRFAPGLNFKWYFNDIMLITILACISGYAFNLLLPNSENRLIQIILIILFGSLVFSLALLASSFSRIIIIDWLKTRVKKNVKPKIIV